MAKELRDENTAGDPIDNPFQLPDLVRVDGPSKLTHEDTAVESQREVDNDAVETRDGRDLEASKTARQLRDEREEAAESNED